MSKFMTRLTQKAGTQFARFTWNNEFFRLNKMPIEANMRAFEEAKMITRQEVAMINPDFKKEPVSMKEWEQVAQSIGSIFFEAPINRHEQLVQLCQFSAYGYLIMCDCIRAGDGADIYAPDPDELEEGQTIEDATQVARLEMYALLKTNADLQSRIREASRELVPKWMQDTLDRAEKVAPKQEKKKAKRKR